MHGCSTQKMRGGKPPEREKHNMEIDSNYKGLTCDICQHYFEPCDNSPSIITIEGNHESRKHEGDRLTLRVCGSCIDWFFDSLSAGGGEWSRVVPW